MYANTKTVVEQEFGDKATLKPPVRPTVGLYASQHLANFVVGIRSWPFYITETTHASYTSQRYISRPTTTTDTHCSSSSTIR